MDFSVAWHAIESVLSLAAVGFLGYVLAGRGWFTDGSTILLARLVTVVTLPIYLFYTIRTSFTHDELIRLASGSLLPFFSIVLTLAASLAAARLLRVPSQRRGPFCCAFSFSNTIFIGLPVNLALFGPQAVPSVLLYYFGNTVLFWTVGNSMIAASGEGERAPLCSKTTLKNIFSPPLIGFILGVTALLLYIPFPPFLERAAQSVGSLTTPLVLICLGVTLRGMALRAIRPDRELVCVLFGRFILCPLLIYALTALFPVPDLMRKVFVIQASLPTIASLSVLAAHYRTDSAYGAVLTATTTLASLVTIPVFMMLLEHAG